MHLFWLVTCQTVTLKKYKNFISERNTNSIRDRVVIKCVKIKVVALKLNNLTLITDKRKRKIIKF